MEGKTNADYRRVMEKYCDHHCRGDCNYYGMMPSWEDKENQYRCPLLEKKMKELDNSKKETA